MRRATWQTAALVASEMGSTWTDATYWTTIGFAGFAVRPVIGVDEPLCEWYSSGGVESVRKYLYGLITAAEAGHTVHVRIEGSSGNTVALGGYGLGPATAVHAGTQTLGNCYYLRVWRDGNVERVDLLRHLDGVIALLSSFVGPAGLHDAISLSYRFAVDAHLTVMVNGVVIGTYTDSSAGKIDMVAVGGKPGIFGHNYPPSDFLVVGPFTTEWWVTDGFESVGELPSAYPFQTNQLHVTLKRNKRYSTSPEPVRLIVSNEVLEASWSFTRIGGCNEASLTFRFGQAPSSPQDLAISEHERLFSEPSQDDWNSNDWLGGMLEIHVRNDSRALDGGASAEKVWAGTVSRSVFDLATRTVKVSADGLHKLLEHAVVNLELRGATIRDALIRVLTPLNGAGGATKSPATDYPVRYNPAKIVGLNTAFDQVILEKDYKWESASSVIADLLAFLPDVIVWGVDQEGEFYVTIPSSPYTAGDFGPSPADALRPVWYDARSALTWTKEWNFDEVVNSFLALGAEPDDNSVPRVSSRANCERSRAMFGLREKVEEVADTTDLGIIAKYAQTLCKLQSSPELSATLKVQEQFRGRRNFWKSASYLTPAVMVMDAVDTINQSYVGQPPSYDYCLRLMGDSPGSMPDLNGTLGAQVRFPSSAQERSLSFSWLLHVTLRFTTACPGGAGDYAFILGRPDPTTPLRGWGALYWDRSTGDLNWVQDVNGVGTTFWTGITVNPVTPANQPVHITISRASNAGLGTITFYSGTTAVRNTGLTLGAMAVNADDWALWKSPASGANLKAWDGGIEQLWVVDTVATGWLFGVPVASQPLGVADFVARNHLKNLARREGCGMLLHGKFNELMATAIDIGGFVVTRTTTDLIGQGFLAPLVSAGTSPIDSLSESSDTAKGHVFGRNRRWGGPLVLQADSVRYTPNLGTGTLTIDYELSARPAGLSRTVAAIEEQVRQQNAALRRITQDI